VTVTLDSDAVARSVVVKGRLRTRTTEAGEYRQAWTKLHETAVAGSSGIVVHDATGWRSNDRLVLISARFRCSE